MTHFIYFPRLTPFPTLLMFSLFHSHTDKVAVRPLDTVLHNCHYGIKHAILALFTTLARLLSIYIRYV